MGLFGPEAPEELVAVDDYEDIGSEAEEPEPAAVVGIDVGSSKWWGPETLYSASKSLSAVACRSESST